MATDRRLPIGDRAAFIICVIVGVIVLVGLMWLGFNNEHLSLYWQKWPMIVFGGLAFLCATTFIGLEIYKGHIEKMEARWKIDPFDSQLSRADIDHMFARNKSWMFFTFICGSGSAIFFLIVGLSFIAAVSRGY